MHSQALGSTQMGIVKIDFHLPVGAGAVPEASPNFAPGTQCSTADLQVQSELSRTFQRAAWLILYCLSQPPASRPKQRLTAVRSQFELTHNLL